MFACNPPPGRRCGLHLAVASSPVARITRCACGTLHVHLVRQRLTLKMQLEELRHLGNALSAAARVIDHTEDPQPAEAEPMVGFAHALGPLN
ncbi:MAG: hypothetical protein ACHREM_27560 [Polyangiales bacterium]